MRDFLLRLLQSFAPRSFLLSKAAPSAPAAAAPGLAARLSSTAGTTHPSVQTAPTPLHPRSALLVCIFPIHPTRSAQIHRHHRSPPLPAANARPRSSAVGSPRFAETPFPLRSCPASNPSPVCGNTPVDRNSRPLPDVRSPAGIACNKNPNRRLSTRCSLLPSQNSPAAQRPSALFRSRLQTPARSRLPTRPLIARPPRIFRRAMPSSNPPTATPCGSPRLDQK